MRLKGYCVGPDNFLCDISILQRFIPGWPLSTQKPEAESTLHFYSDITTFQPRKDGKSLTFSSTIRQNIMIEERIRKFRNCPQRAHPLVEQKWKKCENWFYTSWAGRYFAFLAMIPFYLFFQGAKKEGFRGQRRQLKGTVSQKFVLTEKIPLYPLISLW